jgi:hypothetical protein
MSEVIFTREKLQEMYNREVIGNENKREREYTINSEVLLFIKNILNANSKGYKTYSKYVYKEDETFGSDIADKLCERFEGSIITVDKNTMWRIFNYCMITVTW